MKTEQFERLLESVREMGSIKSGRTKPARTTSFAPDDVRGTREKLELTQEQFATMIGVSVATLRNWEQGRRLPDGPARALLRVAAVHPEAVVSALRR
ncbi:MAG TPA: NadS family protein [Gemmatimonadales bacterium]|nr:NadS family protein [Gemmatimonadales bacterium]